MMRQLNGVLLAMCAASATTLVCGIAGATNRDFAQGSLIIPMDLSYQDHGLLQAYGLVFHLLRKQVRVYWIIDPDKTWHAAPCNTTGDECSWDCAEQGTGDKCPYPTASPDFFAASKVLWDGDGNTSAGTSIASHGYRGGPFVIDAADHDRALEVIDVWNDKSKWAANPWAQRTVFLPVSVHEATASFKGFVRKEMVAAPTIAVFSDGNENIATGYLRAAGIPQSTGAEFPVGKCAAGTCGAGTPNPDMLTVPSVAGDMGTCDAPNKDHRNGQLFRNGVPAYCQIMSMHWAVNDRETVECGGGSCGADQASCGGKQITYHGHEVVAEVRSFLEFPVHFFAECQAVNAYENTTPNPAWPYLDDDGRDGHFLTTTGNPPVCGGGAACTDGDFLCTTATGKAARSKAPPCSSRSLPSARRAPPLRRRMHRTRSSSASPAQAPTHSPRSFPTGWVRLSCWLARSRWAWVSASSPQRPTEAHRELREPLGSRVRQAPPGRLETPGVRPTTEAAAAAWKRAPLQAGGYCWASGSPG